MQVAMEASLKGRRHWLGILYDELSRRDWAERTFAGQSGFCVNKVAVVLSETILRKAEVALDFRALLQCFLFAY